MSNLSQDHFTRPEITKSELAAAKHLLVGYEKLIDTGKEIGCFVQERIDDLTAQVKALETELTSYNAPD